MALGGIPDSGHEEDGGGGIFTDINITPLTDIFLVLLIIFMVSSSVAVETAARASVKVNLPKGATKEIDPGSKSLVVTVLKSGEILVQGQPVAAADLQGLFKSTFAKDPQTQVIIEADSDVAHKRVVGVMSLAKESGLSRLAIATKGGGGE